MEIDAHETEVAHDEDNIPSGAEIEAEAAAEPQYNDAEEEQPHAEPSVGDNSTASPVGGSAEPAAALVDAMEEDSDPLAEKLGEQFASALQAVESAEEGIAGILSLPHDQARVVALVRAVRRQEEINRQLYSLCVAINNFYASS